MAKKRHLELVSDLHKKLVLERAKEIIRVTQKSKKLFAPMPVYSTT